MSIVYVVHRVDDDLSAALQYGELKFITSGYVYPDKLEVDELPRDKLVKLRVASEAFRPNDYLLIAGDHLQVLALAGMLANRLLNYYVLRYDRQAKGYVAVSLPGLTAPYDHV